MMVIAQKYARDRRPAHLEPNKTNPSRSPAAGSCGMTLTLMEAASGFAICQETSAVRQAYPRSMG